jgi:hypothetical protein
MSTSSRRIAPSTSSPFLPIAGVDGPGAHAHALGGQDLVAHQGQQR